MNAQVVSSGRILLQYAVAAAGGWLITHHYLPSTQLDEFVGAAMILVPAGLGMLFDFLKEIAAKKRETVAVQAGATAAQLAPHVTANPGDITNAGAQEIIKTYAPVPVAQSKP